MIEEYKFYDHPWHFCHEGKSSMLIETMRRYKFYTYIIEGYSHAIDNPSSIINNFKYPYGYNSFLIFYVYAGACYLF